MKHAMFDNWFSLKRAQNCMSHTLRNTITLKWRQISSYNILLCSIESRLFFLCAIVTYKSPLRLYCYYFNPLVPHARIELQWFNDKMNKLRHYPSVYPTHRGKPLSGGLKKTVPQKLRFTSPPKPDNSVDVTPLTIPHQKQKVQLINSQLLAHSYKSGLYF